MNKHENKIINIKIETIIENSYLSIKHVQRKENVTTFFKKRGRLQEKNESYLLIPHLFGFYFLHWTVILNTNFILLYGILRKTS